MKFKKKGSLLATTAVSIASWLFIIYVAVVINTSPFQVIAAARTAHQAQQYADIIADGLKVTDYSNVTSKAHARQSAVSEIPSAAGWESQVTISGETAVSGSSGATQRIATINMYKSGDTLSRYSVQVPLSSQSGGSDNFPVGTIIAFSGNIANIPAKWHLCDGTNGTPNLRDRFIVGAGASYGLGAIGGAATIALTTAQLPAHNHSLATSFSGNIQLYGFRAGEEDNVFEVDAGTHAKQGYARIMSASQIFPFSLTLSGNTVNAGSNQAHENRPPYYALYFIMKIQK